jgi:hypothetical protein
MRGATRCRIHGGSLPQVRRKAEVVAQAIIERNVRHYREPRVTPGIDALTEELHRTQGHVNWLGREVTAQPHDANLLTVYTAERTYLAKLAGCMASAKPDEQKSMASERPSSSWR